MQFLLFSAKKQKVYLEIKQFMQKIILEKISAKCNCLPFSGLYFCLLVLCIRCKSINQKALVLKTVTSLRIYSLFYSGMEMVFFCKVKICWNASVEGSTFVTRLIEKKTIPYYRTPFPHGEFHIIGLYFKNNNDTLCF